MGLANASRLLLPILLLTGVAGCADWRVDWNRTVGNLAAGVCRSAGSCTAVCADGSTLDGRPASARCRP